MYGYAAEKLFKAHGLVYPDFDSSEDVSPPAPTTGILPLREDVITAVYNGKTQDGFFNC